VGHSVIVRAEEKLALCRQIFTHAINGITILDLEGHG